MNRAGWQRTFDNNRNNIFGVHLIWQMFLLVFSLVSLWCFPHDITPYTKCTFLKDLRLYHYIIRVDINPRYVNIFIYINSLQWENLGNCHSTHSIKMSHDPSSKTFVFVFIQDVDKMRMALYRFLTILIDTTLSNISKIMYIY